MGGRRPRSRRARVPTHGDRRAAGPLQRAVRHRAAGQGEGVRLRRPLRLRRVRRRPRPAAHRRLHRADQPARRPHPDPVLVAQRRGLAGGRGADHRRGRDVPGPQRDLELGLRAGHDRPHQRAHRPAPPRLRRRAGRAGPPAAVRGQGGGRVPHPEPARRRPGRRRPSAAAVRQRHHDRPGRRLGRPGHRARAAGRDLREGHPAAGAGDRVPRLLRPDAAAVGDPVHPGRAGQDPRRDQPRPGRRDQRVRPGDPAGDAGRAARPPGDHRPRLDRHVRVGAHAAGRRAAAGSDLPAVAQPAGQDAGGDRDCRGRTDRGRPAVAAVDRLRATGAAG